MFKHVETSGSNHAKATTISSAHSALHGATRRAIRPQAATAQPVTSQGTNAASCPGPCAAHKDASPSGISRMARDVAPDGLRMVCILRRPIRSRPSRERGPVPGNCRSDGDGHRRRGRPRTDPRRSARVRTECSRASGTSQPTGPPVEATETSLAWSIAETCPGRGRVFAAVAEYRRSSPEEDKRFDNS